MNNVFVRVMALCTRYPWAVIGLSALLTATSVWFVGTHFRIDTDINGLISKDLPWRKRELAMHKAFPQTTQLIIAVIEADTPEAVGAASRAFVSELNKTPERFRAVQEIGGGAFFDRNGLLFLALAQVKTTVEQLKSATASISILTADPSIRGLVDAFSLALGPAQDGVFEDLPQNLNALARPVEDVLAGRAAAFSWRAYLSGRPSSVADLRRLVTIWPKLDFSALQPGLAATNAVRAAAERSKISAFGAKLRITGPVPIADQEFATLQEGALLNGIVTGVLVLLILFLALKSVKIVIAVSITLAVGLILAAAVGILAVGLFNLAVSGTFNGAFNPISLAFAVLFVGLGADFAIQFSVRYRAERNLTHNLRKGLVNAAQHVGAPLTLAAAAAAAGFMSFLPTTYVGMAELGLIAGVGMAIAYLAAMLLLPALLQIFDPPPEPEPLGYKFMAPVDHFLARHRIAVVVLTSLIAAGGGLLVFTPPSLVSGIDRIAFLPRALTRRIKHYNAISQLRFDFDPLHLRNPKEEAVATYRELTKDPAMSGETMEVLAKSVGDVASVVDKLKAVPEVGEVRSINIFIPLQQDEKLAVIKDALKEIEPAIKPQDLANAATDAQNIEALKTGAANLKLIADAHPGCEGGADPCPSTIAAQRLAGDLIKLAEASPEVRMTAEAIMIKPLVWDIEQIRETLRPHKIALADLPKPIVESWVTADGMARIEALPAETSRRPQVIKTFADAVLKVAPEATGSAIGAYEWGTTIKLAFVYAAAISLVSIALILYVVLRRVTDVLVTLIPLLVAAAVTLEICGLMRFPLNYANIIALPVLLGVGVAFKIYYVTAWRAGETQFLQSPLTRAVFYSALMTAVAFGSLSFSSHPGTASMGKLLALSLACTLASAALFQPALMGTPRQATTA